MVDQTHDPDRSAWRPAPAGAFTDVVEQLDAYFAGELTEFDVELDMPGTDFQQRVWSALRAIPYGETRTYGEIAAQIGAPGASRAVGLANGRNPISIIVPCHRVVGSTGASRLFRDRQDDGDSRPEWLHNSTNRVIPLFELQRIGV